MAQADAVIGRTSQSDSYMAQISSGLSKSSNDMPIPGTSAFGPDWPVEYYIHFFNIANREFRVQKPPMFPNFVLKACPRGEPYVEVMRLPNVVVEKFINADGQPQAKSYQGERVAMDIINPQNPTLDQDAAIPEDMAWMDGGTNDLGRRGIFWTRNEKPTAEELARARARLERFYRAKIQEASAIAQDPRRINELSPEHHLAADYFPGTKLAWHTVAELPANCPNCGEDIKQGAAFHTNSAGVVCVIDWQRAIKAGVKTHEDYKKAQAAAKAMAAEESQGA